MVDVSLRACDEYEEARDVVFKCFEDLGGIDAHKDSKVLIKTNLLKANKPGDMVTTHPSILKAVIDYLREIGVKSIVIGDSPGGPFNAAILKRVYSICGISKLAKDENISLNYNTGNHLVYNSDGVILKEFSLCDFVRDADVIIDCAKLKTHQMTGYTGAVKNLFGCIPGTTKVEYHYRMPNIHDFSNMLLDLALYIKPAIAIIDGVYGMEGQGPSAGTVRKVGAIIASKSPTHADMVGVALTGIAPTDICTIARAKERGIITGELSADVNIIGEDIERMIVHDYKQATSTSVKLFSGRVPKFLEKSLEKAFSSKPVILNNDCVGCGICKDSCPPKAIVMKDGYPVIDRKVCIKCYCCHEMCPQRAITVKRSAFSSCLQKSRKK